MAWCQRSVEAPVMIRVAVVDDHPTVCAGLAAVLRTEAGLSVAGVAHSSAEVDPVLYRTRPDVVLLDYHLPDEDGLAVCCRIKATVPAPGVVLFSAFTTSSLSLAALVAGADGVLDKGASAHSVCEAVRSAARRRNRPWPLDDRQVAIAEASVDPADVPVLRELLRGTSPGDVMDSHGLRRAEFDARVARMLSAIHVP